MTESKEKTCGTMHINIEDAIVCAEKHLGSYRKPMEPYWGSMKANDHLVVGFQLTSRKRWRLDFDPNPSKLVHVNEEDFDAAPGHQKLVHLVDLQKDDKQVKLYYLKWTARYGKRTVR